jgi:dihydroorotate dehydrogenase (fumarate)
VKVGPYYSAFGNMASRLVEAGADGLVLFNRFYQPDLDPLTPRWSPRSSCPPPPSCGCRCGGPRCCTTGSTPRSRSRPGCTPGLDAARAMLAGADVTMMTSALLRHGPGHVATVEAELVAWAEGFDATAIGELRGSASQRNINDPELFERANYIEGLVEYANSFSSAQGAGPW